MNKNSTRIIAIIIIVVAVALAVLAYNMSRTGNIPESYPDQIRNEFQPTSVPITPCTNDCKG